MNIQTAKPSEIDTELHEIEKRAGAIAARRDQQQQYAASYRESLTRQQNGEIGYYSYDAAGLAEIVAKVRELHAQVTAIMAEGDPHRAEFKARDGWTRAWIVTNNNGHVHNTKRCATCNNGEYATNFEFLPQVSGQDELEIVKQAGERACTVCYPTAPVEYRTGACSLEPEERRQARLEREAAAQARAEKKAAKAITNPDGSPLKVFRYHVEETARRNRRTGQVELIPAYDTFETLETAHAARGWLTDHFDSWRSDKRPDDLARVAAAIAAKEGKTADQAFAEAEKRAAKRK